MGAVELLLFVGLPAAAIAAGVVFGIVIPKVRRARQQQRGITLAAFSDANVVAPPRPTRATPHVAAPVAVAPAVTPPAQPPVESPFAPPRREAATGTLGAAWAEPVLEPPRLRLETTAERPLSAPTEPKPPAKRQQRPLDGTLQFLPGRLEVVEGREIGQEIRFVRQAGASTTEVTFGRQDGTQYRHVQLHEPTVSRLHAKMTFDNKEWRLTNLSATNPACVNGAPLGAENGSVILRDGDRLEMGEVVFRFRAK